MSDLILPQHFNLFDVLLICVIAFSVMIGFSRGFIRESLGASAWVLAAFLAYQDFAWPRAFWTRWIQDPFLLQVASQLSVFCGTLMVLMFLAQLGSTYVQNSMAQSVDRSLGLVFGFFRGLLVIELGYIGSLFLMVPTQHPMVVQASKSVTVLKKGALMLKKFIPPPLLTQVVLHKSFLLLQEEQKKQPNAQEMTQQLSQPKPE